MKRLGGARPVLFLFLFGLTSCTTLQATPRAAAVAVQPPIDASAAISRPDPRSVGLHRSFLQRAKTGPIALLFLGDSITEAWSNVPDVWQQYYGRYQPANFGIGGDETQHVLWRIENGELDDIEPRVVVLMIGTNNTARHTARQITAAIAKIVRLIRTALPNTKVLLLAMFPRGPTMRDNGAISDAVHRMTVIHDVNTRLARLDDGSKVRFLDIGGKFLGPDGKIPVEIMPDQLHLSHAGYEIWAAAMQPLLEEMLRSTPCSCGGARAASPRAPRRHWLHAGYFD